VDRVDRLIKKFVTGRLEIELNARKKWLMRYCPPESSEGGKSSKITAPPEVATIKKEEIEFDKIVLDMKNKIEILQMFWSCESEENRKIIDMKYCDELHWYQIASELYMDERTCRRRYNNFKDMIYPYV